MEGNAALDRYLAKLGKLRSFRADMAKIAAPLVEAAARATAAAGTTPDGKAWEPKKGGGRALPNAAAAITARAVGSAILVILRGPYVLHHIGKGHAPKRQIIPAGGASSSLPPGIARALHTASAQAFRRAMGGG